MQGTGEFVSETGIKYLNAIFSPFTSGVTFQTYYIFNSEEFVVFRTRYIRKYQNFTIFFYRPQDISILSIILMCVVEADIEGDILSIYLYFCRNVHK